MAFVISAPNVRPMTTFLALLDVHHTFACTCMHKDNKGVGQRQQPLYQNVLPIQSIAKIQEEK